uniref:Uncharacterized protein n=1 Tax=Arundo donax TaxID=35708 RepID=A0A0A9FW75_ARUDO
MHCSSKFNICSRCVAEPSKLNWLKCTLPFLTSQATKHT